MRESDPVTEKRVTRNDLTKNREYNVLKTLLLSEFLTYTPADSLFLRGRWGDRCCTSRLRRHLP